MFPTVLLDAMLVRAAVLSEQGPIRAILLILAVVILMGGVFSERR